MNTETQKLLEQLAAKLGTTTEYLWGVLVKQAMWSSIIYLIQVGILILFSWLLYKAHKHFSDDNNEISYENSEGALHVITIIITVLTFSVWVVAFFGLHECISGFANPEYWALDYIMKKL